MDKKKIVGFAVVTLVVFLLLFASVLTFSRSMMRELNHDENYFVASGKLLADHGLLPYRDFPYSHLPNLVFIYALLFKASDYILFSARAFSVACASILFLALFLLSYHILDQQRKSIRLVVASGSVLFLLANPLFAYTSGLAWSHDFPVLMVMLAFVAQLVGAKDKRRTKLWVFASGLLAGLALGTRLSFITVLVPFGLALLFYPETRSWKARFTLLLSFGAGVFVGILPAILTFAIAPRKFIYWNTEFFQTYFQYRRTTGEGRMDIGSKLGYWLLDVYADPGNLLLLLSFVFFVLTTEVSAVFRERKFQFGSSLLLLLVLFLALGTILPSPSYYQYFYAPVPFAVLSISFGLARMLNSAEINRKNWLLALFIQIIILSQLYIAGDYKNLAILPNKSAWQPIFVHAVGTQIKNNVGEGTVLTLAPIYPLEGGLDIYPQLATGPFVWRTAHLIPEAQRKEYGALFSLDLDETLSNQVPDAIFLTAKTNLEKPFSDYAQAYSYRQVSGLPMDYWLYIP